LGAVSIVAAYLTLHKAGFAIVAVCCRHEALGIGGTFNFMLVLGLLLFGHKNT
jgi:hypothetical protein